jgi:hypothetical protein
VIDYDKLIFKKCQKTVRIFSKVIIKQDLTGAAQAGRGVGRGYPLLL